MRLYQVFCVQQEMFSIYKVLATFHFDIHHEYFDVVLLLLILIRLLHNDDVFQTHHNDDVYVIT